MSFNDRTYEEMIAKYHQGQLSDAEMNALERQALEDPFLSDALEGMALLENDIPLDHLNENITKRIEVPKSNGFYQSFIAPFILVTIAAVSLNPWFHEKEESLDLHQHEVPEEMVSNEKRTIDIENKDTEEAELVINKAKVIPKKEWIQNLLVPKAPIQSAKEDMPKPDVMVPMIITGVDTTKENIETPNIKNQVSQHPVYYLSDLKVANYNGIRTGDLNPDRYNHSLSAQYESDQSERFSHQKEERILYTEYLETCMKNFNKGKLKMSLRGFNHILQTYPDDANALFYSGLAYYNLDMPEKSEKLLRLSFHHDFGVFKHESEWYLALALLKLDNKEESKLIMEKIVRQKGFYAQRAKKALDDL